MTQLVIAVVIRNHANGHEISNFPALFKSLTKMARLETLVLDKGYDAEWVHQMIREHDVLSMIPVRKKGDGTGRLKGRFRKQMRRSFDHALYHQRNKCETVFSVIKRRFGSEIKSYDDAMKERELLYRVLAYNCHRMSMISCLLRMVSREP